MALSRCGVFLATGSSDGTARVWATESGKGSHTLEADKSPVVAAKFTKDMFAGTQNDTLLVTLSASFVIRWWSIWSGKCVFHIEMPKTISLAFAPNGKAMLGGTKDRRVVLQGTHRNFYRLFDGHDGAVNSVAFAPGFVWEDTEAVSMAPGSSDYTSMGNCLSKPSERDAPTVSEEVAL